MPTFYYVYILVSEVDSARYYVGFTEDLRERLRQHNANQSSYTSEHGPWRLKTYLAFSDRPSALDFERYLKSASGRAFAKKRL
jgi:putative endonuclease